MKTAIVIHSFVLFTPLVSVENKFIKDLSSCRSSSVKVFTLGTEPVDVEGVEFDGFCCTYSPEIFIRKNLEQFSSFCIILPNQMQRRIDQKKDCLGKYFYSSCNSSASYSLYVGSYHRVPEDKITRHGSFSVMEMINSTNK